VLPILDGIELAGRMDAKVHRKTGLLEIKALYLENELIKSPEGILRLKNGIDEFAQFHACHEVKFNKVSPRKFTKQVRA
jgi:uncharacterized protein YcaQ